MLQTTTGRTQPMRGALLAALASVLLAALACASADTVELLDDPNDRALPMQRPERVLVFEFAVNAGEVSLNSGLGAKAMRAGETREELRADEDALGHEVARQLAEEISQGLKAQGIEAIHVGPDTPLLGPALGVDGHFLVVDQGDKLERAVIGFGAGATHVRTMVQFQSLANGSFQTVHEFDTDAHSGEMPGAATPLGVGAVTGDVVRGAVVAGAKGVDDALSDDLRSGVKNTAKVIVREVARFYASRGWIDASKLPK